MKVSILTRSSLVSAIKNSTSQKSLPVGKSTHAHIIKLGFLPETQLYNHLLNLYSKSSDFVSARILFDEMPDRNLVSYSTLISGYSQSGKQIHAQAIVSDLESDPFVKTSLVDMYSKLEDLGSAVSVFSSSPPIGDPVMYNSMISGLVSFGSYEEALELFAEALREIDLKPTEFTFGGLIKACSNLGREVGEQIHSFSLKTGFDSVCFVGTSLIDMYGRLGDMESSKKIFQSIPIVDLALYNSMIVGFSNNELQESALEFFGELKRNAINPDECTFSNVLKSCGGLKFLGLGRIIHGVVVKSEFWRDLVINTSLVDMYMKCGCVKESCRLFYSICERNAVLYNSMIYGHGQNGDFDKAVRLFIDMSRLGFEPNHATFVALMNSCVGHERSVYVHVIKRGLGLDLTVQNALLDSLVKGGAVEEAQQHFSKMHERNVVSWTTIISGFAQLGLASDALELFKEMQLARICPNSFTFSSVLNACGSLTDLEKGRCIHGCSIKYGIMDEEFTNSSLLDMYAKSCAQHGNGEEALELFERMEKYGVEPNQVSFTSLLSACSHCGLVDDGVHVFESITHKHGMVPSMDHYACMVDMFGRAGMLERAKCLIYGMPYEPDALIWKTFLAACRLHGDLQLAQLARDHVLSMEGEDNATLVTISNIYSELGKWDDVERVRRRMRYRGRRKESGVSWVQIKDKL
ncbi:hypothetical protein HHK36_007339 [Tetracentron sinense]|uniref:Pentatricopeptide repeat-containing protein n=1 Tax=Tetracentron sinense TaxID=13715 RepID=A0A835DQ13_TETSI|nr:hypothetical protein HHK36_007339 [Tetracentron sinense]